MTTTMVQQIELRLRAALAPTRLEVIDESAAHGGHAGAGGGGHYRVRVESPRFAGEGALARHRAVYAALADELRGGIHALAIEARAPGE